MESLVERVAQHFLVATAIHWKKFPGSVAQMTRVPGGSLYSKSADGRFMIFVTRSLQGQPGDRSYVYHFSAVDYWIPSSGNRFTNIPIQQPGGSRENSSNVKRVFESVEKWAHEHPLYGPST
jgi:hypothetical protein